jgi:hypothetical protein
MQTAQAPAADLRDRIVRGARERDLVQLHGAIVGTLELFPVEEAEGAVFAAAIGRLGSDEVAHELALAAMLGHLALYRATSRA